MTKKKTLAKKVAQKKEAPKVDIKMTGKTSMDPPTANNWPDEIPPDTEEFKITKNIEAILKKDISKSDKMRALYRMQITKNKEIAYWTVAHPSFVATVINKLKRSIDN